MRISDLFHYISELFPKPPENTKEAEKKMEKRIVAKYGQGNASLQLGLYITEEEIELKKKELSTYRF